jgi:hypothetical protein
LTAQSLVGAAVGVPVPVGVGSDVVAVAGALEVVVVAVTVTVEGPASGASVEHAASETAAVTAVAAKNARCTGLAFIECPSDLLSVPRAWRTAVVVASEYRRRCYRSQFRPNTTGSKLSASKISNVKTIYNGRHFCNTDAGRGLATRREQNMSRFFRGCLVALSAGPMVGAAMVAPSAVADDTATWDGTYAVTFYVNQNTGTSIAATRPEGEYTDNYTFTSSCEGGPCVATIIAGPAPRNPTVPQPVQFTWDGSSWASTTDFQWDCLRDDGSIEWNPASSEVSYTPNADGSLSGRWHNDIASGLCQGTVDITMRADPL